MKATIAEAIGINGGSEEIDMLERKVNALNRKMLDLVNDSIHDGEDIEKHEAEFKELSETIEMLKSRIKALEERGNADDAKTGRISQMQQIISGREKRKLEYDDVIVRQMVECIKVYPDGKLEIIFGGGYIGEEYIDVKKRHKSCLA